MDPYNNKKVETVWAANLDHINQLPDSTLVLWDSHFMKLDGKIPFNWLSENSNFTMLKHYAYINNKRPFDACLFIKKANPSPVLVPIEYVSPTD